MSAARPGLRCPSAARELEAQGIFAEIIDLRGLKPLDQDAVLQSARKTGRLVVVHEAGGLCGIAAEFAALVATNAFSSLRAPVVRLTGPDAPALSSWALEQAAVPRPDAVVHAVLELLGDAPRRAFGTESSEDDRLVGFAPRWVPAHGLRPSPPAGARPPEMPRTLMDSGFSERLRR